MNYAPTNKVATVGAAGGTVTIILQLLQQYAPSFHPPSAATVSLIVTWLVTVAGWIAKESKASGPVDPFPPIRPVNPSPPVQVPPPPTPLPPPRPVQ